MHFYAFTRVFDALGLFEIVKVCGPSERDGPR
jgi:hypothetical protein